MVTIKQIFGGVPMYLALAALIGGTVLSGITPVLVRLAETDPAATGFWRMVLALPLVLLLARGRAPMGRSDIKRLIVAGAAYGADLAVWYWAIALTTVVNAQLFAFSYPLWVMLYVALGRGQRLGGRNWLALIFSLGGAVAVIGGKLALSGWGYVGDGLGLAAALLFSVTLLNQSEARRRVDAGRVLLVSSLAAAAVLLPVALMGKGAFFPVTPQGWILLAGFSLSAQTAQLLVIYALGRLPVTFAAITGGLYVVIGALAAWVWLGEGLGLLQMTGVAVVLTGITLADRRERTAA
jgi:drug/metabolite transporter (DMT)-like permease